MKNELEQLPENPIVWMQRWEESEAGWGVREDGMSLHLTEESVTTYIEKTYSDRDPSGPVPAEYTRHDGKAVKVALLSSELYNKILENDGMIRTYKSLYRMTKVDNEIKLI